MSTPFCGICNDIFTGLSSLRLASCGHVYHTECIVKSKMCGRCRRPLLNKKIRKVSLNFTPEFVRANDNKKIDTSNEPIQTSWDTADNQINAPVTSEAKKQIIQLKKDIKINCEKWTELVDDVESVINDLEKKFSGTSSRPSTPL